MSSAKETGRVWKKEREEEREKREEGGRRRGREASETCLANESIAQC